MERGEEGKEKMIGMREGKKNGKRREIGIEEEKERKKRKTHASPAFISYHNF